jgi:DNA polymerase III sliding clamp (beta) subunit (PCNA family)
MTTTLAPIRPADGPADVAAGLRLRIDRAALTTALKAVGPAVGRASDPPAATGVRLAATASGAVTVTCSRPELTIDYHLDHGVEVRHPGTVVVAQARLLTRVVRALPAGPVALQGYPAAGRAGVLVITAGDTTVRLPALPVDRWPDPPNTDGQGDHRGQVVLGADQLDLLRRLLPLADTDRARPALCALHFFAGGLVEATDSYRLGVARLGTGLAADVVVPAQPLGVMLRATKKARLVGMALDAEVVAFSNGTTTWTIPVDVDARYPDTTRYRDGRPGHRVEVDAHQLADAVARTRTVGGDATTVRLDLESDRLILTRLDIGDGIDLTATVPASGDLPPVAFNPRFLADLVTALAPEGGPVVIEADDDRHPAYARTDQMTVALMPARR